MFIVNFSREIDDRLSNPERDAANVCPRSKLRNYAAFVPALRARYRRHDELPRHGASVNHLRRSISNRHIPQLETYLTSLEPTCKAALIATKQMFRSALGAPRLA
jgi:hypothetical protein